MATKTEKIEFPLLSSVRLTPLSGDTTVCLVTTGDVVITDQHPSGATPRPHSIPIARTERGLLSSSPKGFVFTLKVILPVELASEEEFLRQVRLLFEKMRQDSSDC